MFLEARDFEVGSRRNVCETAIRKIAEGERRWNIR